MTSRRRQRVGGGQTARPSVQASVETPPIRSLANETPPARAQSAVIVQSDHAGGATGLQRATTASARSSDLRRTGRMRSRGEMFLPPADLAYEAKGSTKFYTTSTACKLARIHSDPCIIQPAWARVSASPWGEAAKMCGGYGKRILNGSNSVETPEFMRSKRFDGYERNLSWKKRLRPFAYHGEANTAVSHDTPAFFRGRHTQVYGRPIEKIYKPRLIKIMLGRQTMAEPAVPETELDAPLEWEDLSVTGSRVVVAR